MNKLFLLVILILNIANGFMRYHYIVDFSDRSNLIKRRVLLKFAYPNSIDSLFQSVLSDPRWISNVYYSLIAALSTSITLYIIKNKQSAFKAIFCYLILWMFCGFFLFISIITGDYKLGLGIAQELKNLSQSPLISFLIMVIFYFSSIDFKSASE